jgi:hypothetical protein
MTILYNLLFKDKKRDGTVPAQTFQSFKAFFIDGVGSPNGVLKDSGSSLIIEEGVKCCLLPKGRNVETVVVYIS